jgi:short-subunit dehydrogenase
MASIPNPVSAVAKTATRLANVPVGLIGRDRPIDVVGRLRGGGRLADAVDQRIVMITGASQGIGAATAQRIGAAGGTVLLVARSVDKLEQVASEVQEAGGTAHVHACDLSDFEALDRMAEEVLSQHGRVDVLINNAGRSIRRSLALSYDRFHDYERTMQLNYFVPVRLILRLIPGMRERGDGHIVNISSAGVPVRTPRFGAYIASKAALDTLSDALQAEVIDENVHFTTVQMPLVRTPMISPTKMYDRFPALTPEQAAQVVARAIVHRPRRVSPAFGYAAAFADALSPELMDLLRNQGFRMFPDSGAARGDRSGSDEAPNTAGSAFAHATRGIHW